MLLAVLTANGFRYLGVRNSRGTGGREIAASGVGLLHGSEGAEGSSQDRLTLPIHNKLFSGQQKAQEVKRQRIGEVVNLPGRPLSIGNITIQLQNDADISLYSLLWAIDNEYVYLLRVIDLNYYSPVATPQSVKMKKEFLKEEVSPEAAMSHFFAQRIARAELIDVAKRMAGGHQLIGPKRIPCPGTPVYAVDSEIRELLFGKQEDPITIGTLVDTNIEVTIDIQKLNRHVLIIGTTGTGKSWLRGVLLEKIHELGVPQVIFDPLRDYTEAVRELSGINLRYGQNFLPSLAALPTDVFASMLKPVLTPLQLSIAIRAFEAFKREASRNENVDPLRLIEHIRNVAHSMRAQEDTRENTVARVETLLRELGYIRGNEEGILRYISSNRQHASSLILSKNNLANFINNRKIINIDLYGVDDLALQVTVASVLSQILSLRAENRIPPLVVSFDEAHRIAPRVRSRNEAPPSLLVVKNLARYGRHYGIGLIVITQYPDSVDVELIRLPATRFIFAIDSDQLGAIKGLLGDLPDEIRDNLPKLEKGTAFLAGTMDVVRHTLYVRITSERRTTHGGSAPKFRTVPRRG